MRIQAGGRGVVQRARIAILPVLVLLSLFTVGGSLSASGPSSSSFTFAAAGDLDANANANSSLVRLSGSGTNFFLAIGDLSYNTITPETSWCNYVKSYVGQNYPFQLLSGNHEDGNEEQNGLIDNFAQCLPNQVGTINGTYAKEYYFDYPSSAPLARFILISPGLNFTFGGYWSYGVGTSHYNWLASAIDSARAAGIRWIIVGDHEVCISAGQHPCEIGSDVMNLLMNRKVDLVLQGHDHTYQRSKQLSCGQAELYISSCVVNDGSSGVYTEGAGTVFVISGTFGAGETPIQTSDPDLPYFAKTMGNTTQGAGHGFVKYTVSSTSITAQTVFSGSFSDSFGIQSGIVPQGTINFSPANPGVGLITNFTASATSGTAPYTFSWNFGDGGTATGSKASHMFLQPGYYTVTLTTRDSASNTGTTSRTVPVGSWNPAVTTCAPYVTTLEALVGNISIARGGGRGADYSGGAFQLAGNLPFASNPTTWPYLKRALPSSLPCSVSVNGTLTAAFVEIDNVQVRGISVEDCGTINGTSYCDTTFNVCDPTGAKSGGGDTQCSSTYPDTMFKFHTEIDQMWKAHGIAPKNPGPNGSTCSCYVDLQGWVFWDTQHITESWHSFSGWEIHPLAAWRFHVSPPTVTFNTTPSSPSPGQAVTFSATASGGVSPYTFTWDFGDGTIAKGPSVSHTYPAGSYSVRVAVQDSKNNISTASSQLTVADKPPTMSLVLSSNTAQVGQTVIVSITSSDPDGTITQTVVDWGDDTIDTFATKATSDGHVYSTVGNYLVKVTVTDNGGVTAFDADPEQVTNFTVSANPTSVTALAGQPGTSTISVTSVNGFSGTVSLSVLSSDMSCSISPATVTLGLQQSSNLSCNVGTAGNYTVTVAGTSGSLSHSAIVNFVVQDFQISANPNSIPLNVTQTGNSVIAITPVNGFSGVVGLSQKVSPSSGLSCTLSPSTVTGSGHATLSCTASVVGNYTVTVTGTAGSLLHSAAITYTVGPVQPPDFTVTSNPTAVTILAGKTGNSTITVTPINGFAGPVALSSSVSPNMGLSCSLSATSVIVSGSSQTAVLSCASSISGAGIYNVTVAGTSGTLSHSTTVGYAVQDFTISPSGPLTVSCAIGATCPTTITVSPLNGFTGTVTLSFNTPSGLSCNLSPSRITSGSGTSTLSCSATVPNDYVANVTGTSASLSHTTANLTYHITSGSFSLTANPTNAAILNTQTVTSTITLTSSDGFTGTVALTVSTAPSTGLSCTLNPSTITGGSGSATLSCTASVATNYVATVVGTSGGLSSSTTFSVTVQDFAVTPRAPTSVTVLGNAQATFTLTVTPLSGFTGTVTFPSTVNVRSLTCNLNPASIALGPATNTTMSCNGAAGNYTVTVAGTSGILSHSATVTVIVQDFSVSASTVTPLAINPGSSGSSTITVSPVNGFTGSVTLSLSAASGLSCALNPTTITGGSGTSTLTCTAITAADYVASITGASGTPTVSRSTGPITFRFVDFNVTANPTSVTANAGTAATSTVTVSPINGFTGTVSLSLTVSSAGLTCSLSPTSVTLGSSQPSTMFCTGSAGSYTVTVTGTSGSLSHTTKVNVSLASAADVVRTASAESDIAPESQQRVFRDPRGLQGYYVFYRQSVAGLDRCYYAYSAGGTSWVVNQTISDIASFSGMNSCSVTFWEDTANSRLVVYVVFTKPDTVTGTSHGIRLAIGFIPDSGLAISWSNSQLVRPALQTELMAYATIARANDGYLFIAAAYVVANSTSSNYRQNVIVCASMVQNPVANPAWRCSNPASAFPFAGTSVAGVTKPSYMPEIVGGLIGHEVLVIAGSCMGSSISGPEYLACADLDTTEQTIVLDWDGTNMTWSSPASFTPSPGSPADRRSATINPSSGRVHYAYQDGTSAYLSRFLDSPYGAWSAPSTITSITAPTPAGLHLSFVTGTSTPTLIAFYVLPSNGDIFSRNATDTEIWGAQQVEMTNSTTNYKVVSSQNLIDGSKVSTLPYVWIATPSTGIELWFRVHVLPPTSQQFAIEGLTAQQSTLAAFGWTELYCLSAIFVALALTIFGVNGRLRRSSGRPPNRFPTPN